MTLPTLHDLNLAWRGLRMAAANPNLILTEWRKRRRISSGIPRDRKRPDGVSAPPVSLSINLTRRCNLKCLMCSQHRKGDGPPPELAYYRPDQELEIGQWIDILDQAARFKPQLYVTGGEPTLYYGFKEFIAAAKARKLVVHLQTNGTRLADLAEFLVEQGIDQATVSLDGPEEVHNRIRGVAEVYQRTARGVAALVEARKKAGKPGPLIAINCVITPDNLELIDRMPEIAADLGADLLQIQHLMFNSPDRVGDHNRRFSPELARAQGFDLIDPSVPEGEYCPPLFGQADLKKIKEQLARLKNRPAGRPKILFMPRLDDSVVGPYYLDLDYPFSDVCSSLWRRCRILPDGTVAPCLHVLVGNAAKEPLLEVWNSAQMTAFRRLIAKRIFPGCVRCCHRPYED